MALTAEQKRAYDEMQSGKNIFLSGRAGTGKSYLLDYFIKKSKDKNVLVCAPTGVAAINIGGTTIHRAFKAPIRPLIRGTYNVEPTEEVKTADIIIIDEISMCRFDLFNFVADAILKAEQSTGKRKQLIVVGDFFQLPPVINKRDLETFGNDKRSFAFQAETWSDFKFRSIVLNNVLRQNDNEFIENLNKIRQGDLEGVRWINKHSADGINDGIYLCGTNIRAKAINDEGIENLKSENVHYYFADTEGDVEYGDKFADDCIKLKVGARVMSLINDMGDRYQNGSMGTVRKCDDNSVVVEFDNGNVEEFSQYTWEIYAYKKVGNRLVKDRIGKYSQLPLKLAYAITIHKSQGKTFDKVTLFPNCFVSGQLYVALSRVTSIEGLSLDFKIKDKDLITSDEVIRFYSQI